MPKCFVCGGPLRVIREGLFRCYICGQLQELRGLRVVPVRMRVYPSIDEVRASAIESNREQAVEAHSDEGLSRDMVAFINRVAEALTPIAGYEGDRAFVSRALKVRNQFKRELVEVFEGKRKFQDWYNSTRTGLGKNEREMDEIIYEALSGLSDPDAVSMREAFEEKLRGRLI